MSMTLIILLAWGLGAVFIVSALETITTGHSVSIRQTIGDIWNNQVDFAQQGNEPRAPGQRGVPYASTAGAGNLGTPGGGGGTPGGVVWVNSAGTVVGRAEGPAQYDAYRAATVRAYIQSQR